MPSGPNKERRACTVVPGISQPRFREVTLRDRGRLPHWEKARSIRDGSEFDRAIQLREGRSGTGGSEAVAVGLVCGRGRPHDCRRGRQRYMKTATATLLVLAFALSAAAQVAAPASIFGFGDTAAKEETKREQQFLAVPDSKFGRTASARADLRAAPCWFS